jgi:8-oxo-dGTP pyrophosphatase MutT (NUDIX family)
MKSLGETRGSRSETTGARNPLSRARLSLTKRGLTKRGLTRLGPSGRLRSGALGFLLSLALSGLGRPEAFAHQRSNLEQSLIRESLEELGLVEDASPKGKVVESILVWRVDVFDERDPVPDWLNVLHGTSRDRVIRREVLIGEGEPYDPAKVEETERNLRALRQLSLANIVAARGSGPDRVKLVVITKDVWSLRLNSDLAFGPTGLERLLLNPSEENLLGTHMSFGLLYQYERYRHTFGARFIYPRVGGSRFRTAAEARIFVARETGQAEGTSGVFAYSLPLFSRYSRWGMSTSLEWFLAPTRFLSKNELIDVPITVDGQDYKVPWYYQEQRLLGELSGTRSFGVNRKLNLRSGLEIDERRYRADQLSDNPSLQRAYEESAYVPVSDVQLRPFVSLTLNEAKFLRVISFESLGFQEDIRIGYSVAVTTWVGSQALGSTRDLWGVSTALGYSRPLGNGLVSGRVSHSTTLGNDSKNDAVFGAGFRVASPWLGFGRVHLDIDLALRYENYRRVSPYFLGGNSRLRGYPSNYLSGPNELAANLEFRSASLDILSAQVGLVGFYDVGDTPTDLGQFSAHHSLGTGIRIVFPQAERQVLRADWGFPIGDAALPAWPGGFFVTFGQAFGLP